MRFTASTLVSCLLLLLTACGSGSSSDPNTTVTPPPTLTLSVSPSSVERGSSATLTWSSTNSTSCTASGGLTGTQATSGSQSTGALSADTTFTLSCAGAGGTIQQTAAVIVTAVPAPSVTISANPSTLSSGQNTVLTWSSSNATSCTASGGWSGAQAASGTQNTGPLTAATTYTLNCTGAGGSAQQSATVTVAAATPPAPTVTLSANPSTLLSGQSTALTWGSTNATVCAASGGWTSSNATSGTQTTAALTANTTFTLSCTGPGGSAQQSVTVTVTSAAPAPLVILSANPSTVVSGRSTVLTWSATNATSCSAIGGWTSSTATSGTQATAALTANTTYTLSCTGAGGTTQQNTTVTVTPPPPSVSLSANPSTVGSGRTAVLTWSSANATSCSAIGGWTSSTATSGTQTTAALTANTTYTLSCTGAGGTTQQSTTVTVNPPPPTVTIGASPSTVVSGGTTTITWSSTNATSCSAIGGWTSSTATSGTQTTAALTANTTYTLGCTGPGGSAQQSTTVTVSAASAPSVTLSASPSTVASGNTTTITWSSTNATSCAAIGGWTSSTATSGSQTTTALTATTTFTLGCTGTGGTTQQGTTVTVTPPPPTVTISASPSTVVSGNTTTITWSSTNATSCSAIGAWTSSTATSGSQTTTALTATTTFTLSCTGTGGTTQQSTTVTVTSGTVPTVTLSANPTTLLSGTKTTLTWTSTNATTCTATSGWSGSQSLTGSADVGPVTNATTFQLSCTGAGGTQSASASVATVAANPVFPLSTVAGKRYLVTASGQPFLLHGDSAWDLISTLSDSDADAYLTDRSSKGFNTVLVELMEHYYSPNPPYDANGDAPLTGTIANANGSTCVNVSISNCWDFSTPNEAYFAHVEWVINDALQKNMLVLLTPAYMGYQGGNQGWYQDMVANGATKMQNFGRYLAARFAAYPNILWVEGGDYDPPALSLLNAIPTGMRQLNTVWLHTFHGARNNSALGFLGPSAPAWLGVNDIYTDETDVVASGITEYQRSTMPFFLIEDRYEGDNNATALTVRLQSYQAVLSGGTGQLMGNSIIWPYSTGWQTALNSPASTTIGYLRTLLEAHAWWILQPDAGGTFLTSGAQSGEQSAAAAVASDGSFGLIYTPSSRSLVVNFAQLTGPHVNACWYDPTAGTCGSISGSPFSNSGSQTLTPPATPVQDWVLVLESTP